MDGTQFDRISRALGAATTRRAGIAAAFGALIGGTAAGTARAKPGAGKNPAPQGPCGNGSNKDNACSKDNQCCTKYCADGFCRCKPNWMTCAKDAHCCSGKCILGQCDGGCNPKGSRCRENFNCCTGLICSNGRCAASNKAKCGTANCTGCCDGTMCRVGASAKACGKSGGACAGCAANTVCTNGTCKLPAPTCNASNCASGCCQNGACQPGTADAACGAGGAACAACTGGQVCQSQVCAAACDRTVGAAIGGAVTDTTIQSAIDAAPDGGKVCIQAGTYTANSGTYIASITKNLTIEGADQATVILDGLAARCGLSIGAFNYLSAITVTVSKLTVQNSSDGDGGAVYVFGNTSMTVNMTDVTVKNSAGVNGLYLDGLNNGTGPVFNGTRVTLTGNDIRPNTGRGGGFLSYGATTLTDCDITNNSVSSEGAGFAIVGGGSLTMTGGSLSGNHAYPINPSNGNGGAFMFYADSVSPVTATFTNVSITNNVADTAGGVGYYNNVASTVTMTDCTVTGNTSPNCSCVYYFNSGISNYVCDSSYCS